MPQPRSQQTALVSIKIELVTKILVSELHFVKLYERTSLTVTLSGGLLPFAAKMFDDMFHKSVS